MYSAPIANLAAPVALVLRLDADAPRHVELGCPLPLLRLRPGSPVLHLQAELALARFGMDVG